MKFSALCFVAFVSSVAALPLDNVISNTDVNVRNSVFEELILGLLEQVREIMLTGSDDLIPVLDPLVINELHLELDELGLPNSRITIGDAQVEHLSTFVIEDLAFTSTNVLLQRYDLVIDGHIPVLEIDCAKYDLSVNALGVHVFGVGDAKIRIIRPRITATIGVGLGILGGISLNIRNADVVFYLDAFEPQITGLFGNNLLDNFINSFLGNLLPELVEYFQPQISEVINSIIEGIGSIDLNREDIAAMLQPLERNPLSPANA